MAKRTPQDEFYKTQESSERALNDFYAQNKAREAQEKRALNEFYEQNRDTERGIQNVRTREGYAEVPPEAVLNKTISRQFDTTKGIRARAEKKRWGREDPENEKAYEYGASFDETKYAVLSPAEQLRAQLREVAVRRASRAVAGRAVQKLTSRAKWWVVSIVTTLFLWQFLFALISLVGFGLQATVEHTQQNTLIGNVLSLIVDYSKYFPGQYLGLGAWGIAVLIAVCTFLGLIIWYRMIGVRIFDTTVTTSLTILCLSLSILPVTNLFPTLLLWCLYMNRQPLRPLFST